MNHDVLPIHRRIKHPQTQGKIERLHRTMKSELIKYKVLDDVFDADNAHSPLLLICFMNYYF